MSNWVDVYVVEDAEGGRYYTNVDGFDWTYATPVHPDECLQER